MIHYKFRSSLTTIDLNSSLTKQSFPTSRSDLSQSQIHATLVLWLALDLHFDLRRDLRFLSSMLIVAHTKLIFVVSPHLDDGFLFFWSTGFDIYLSFRDFLAVRFGRLSSPQKPYMFPFQSLKWHRRRSELTLNPT